MSQPQATGERRGAGDGAATEGGAGSTDAPAADEPRAFDQGGAASGAPAQGGAAAGREHANQEISPAPDGSPAAASGPAEPDRRAQDGGAAAPGDLVRAVEATLFAAEAPMSAEQLSAHLNGAAVRPALAALEEHYRARGIRLVERGRRWQFQTAPDLAHLLRREKEQLRRLSRAATECLAIIAYHEPVSRAEIEAIRGVQTAGGTLDVLMEAGWVRIAGRREVPGRPVIYATTPEFLSHFGLASRRDLPGLDELKAAGLLDPVDEAYEALVGGEAGEASAGEDRRGEEQVAGAGSELDGEADG